MGDELKGELSKTERILIIIYFSSHLLYYYALL